MADPHHTDSDYQRGSMEIGEQTATWRLFMNLSKWGSLILASLLTLVVLCFCTPAGFIGGLIAGVVLFVAGFFFLKSGGGH